MSVGWGEWGVVLVIALLVFGGKRLPELSRNLGRTLRSFQRGWQEVKDELTREPPNYKKTR